MSGPFAILTPLLGKTWRGVFSSSTPEKPAIDISRWELALNGKIVRNLHSVNDGEYGGESIILWDPESEGLIYFYFTTSGFYTQGSMREEHGQIVNHEMVTGNENGVTEVKSVMRFMPDGSLHTQAMYYQNGAWVEGHAIHYVEDARAEVKFKKD